MARGSAIGCAHQFETCLIGAAAVGHVANLALGLFLQSSMRAGLPSVRNHAFGGVESLDSVLPKP